VLARLVLLLAVFSLRAPSAQAAASETSNDDLARYADQLFSQTYPANEPGAAVLVMKDGQVVLRPTGRRSRSTLKVEDVQVGFQRGPDGKATGLTLFQGGRKTPAKKVK
jgi:CubicO group peptidase (beta-lactamase class C family)